MIVTPPKIIVAVLLTLGIGLGCQRIFNNNYEIRKKEVLGSSMSEAIGPTNTPTATITPSSTPKPVVKKFLLTVTQPIPTTIPVIQKVPVYLQHDGTTKMCERIGIDAVKNASEGLYQQKSEYKNCLKTVEASVLGCISVCDTNYSHLIDTCQATYDFYSPAYTSCRTESNTTHMICYDSCKNTGISCNAVSYDALNSLVAQYCQ